MAMALEARVLKLETQLVPEAKVRVVEWFERCEPQEEAIKRAGEVGPDDLVIICATWLSCTRPGKHRHDDALVVVHAKRR
jgi:hypothetical protein